MVDHQPIRKYISNNDKELIIYGADNFSQFPRRNASLSSKCDRALPVAHRDDLVVLRENLDQEYYNWLRSQGLGPDHVVEYKALSGEMTLSELIINNPEPIKEIIKKTGRKPVYVPWYSGRLETAAAQVLGADLFGASEAVTVQYNDKAAFKEICRQLGVPVVEGALFEIESENNKNFREMKNIIDRFLATCKTVIIRGTLGEAGMSLYKTNGNDILELYQEIAGSGEKAVIIEPFLNVLSSPNDQWVVGRSGSINHHSIREQILDRGMVHIGTLKREKISADISNYTREASSKILDDMAKSGYKGVVGIDYIVSDDGIFPIENNARFNGSSYASMIVDNIEELTSPIPCWKFIKTKTAACSFLELVEKLKPVIYDGKKLNSIFPFSCDTLPLTGNFAILILAEHMNQIFKMEDFLKEMGIKS